MTFKGCLFDFSGTLFRVESAERWLRGGLAKAGINASPADITRYADRLDALGALAGGRPPGSVPARLERTWADRDLDAEHHRAAFTGLTEQAGLPWPGLAGLLYDRHMTASAWAPYPDAVEVLATLRERGARVALVSNIGWDLRPVLDAHGVAGLLDAVVLSFEEGIQKPDPRVFHTACGRLGLDPRDVLMVGDSAEADGGAVAIGCGFHEVEHLPVDLRPDGLRPVLGLVG